MVILRYKKLLTLWEFTLVVNLKCQWNKLKCREAIVGKQNFIFQTVNMNNLAKRGHISKSDSNKKDDKLDILIGLVEFTVNRSSTYFITPIGGILKTILKISNEIILLLEDKSISLISLPNS